MVTLRGELCLRGAHATPFFVRGMFTNGIAGFCNSGSQNIETENPPSTGSATPVT
jgi:hypothetical protein